MVCLFNYFCIFFYTEKYFFINLFLLMQSFVDFRPPTVDSFVSWQVSKMSH